MRNRSVNGFSLRSDSILHFFFFLLLWPFPDKLLNSRLFFVTLEPLTDNLPPWRLSLLFAKIFRSFLSRYKLLKKMLPGELASFLQRRLFGGFATFPSILLSFLLLLILRSVFFRYVFFSYGPLFFLFPFHSYCISFRKLSNARHRYRYPGINFFSWFRFCAFYA